MNDAGMKKFSIIFLIGAFLVFFAYEKLQSSNYEVLEVISPTQIIVDLNQNSINDDEPIVLENIETFSTKLDENQIKLAKKMHISNEEAVGIGFLAEYFSKETLLNKKIKLKNKKTPQIFIENKNYENLLLSTNLAFKKGKNIDRKSIKKNLKKIHALNLVIFNNKSQKYHKLTCKYGLLAHNAQIIPAKQLPKDAKACKFCHKTFHKHKKINKKQYKKEFEINSIPEIPSPKAVLSTGSIKLFLTDLTRVLKPNKNCENAFCKTLVNEVNQSQNTIDIAIYGYTKIPELQSAIVCAQKRGVKIRLVYDVEADGSNYYPDTLYLTSVITDNQTDLAPLGRKNKTKYQGALMHNKFFVFDNKKVLTGSANISSTDTSGFNSNAILLIDSAEIAALYEQEFEQMYFGKFHNSKKQIKSQRTFLTDNSEISVYFSPKDEAIVNYVIPITDLAKKYIYMPVFLITHKELAQSLIRAKKRGVDVKVIIDATNSHLSASKHKMLRDSGILVKTENFAGKLHSKSIIIDDTYTIIGSMNFSKSGENSNDENIVIIKNNQIAKFYKTFFEYFWKRIPDKWLHKNARSESPDSVGSCSDGIDNDFDGKIDMLDDSCKIKK